MEKLSLLAAAIAGNDAGWEWGKGTSLMTAPGK